jgi:hypothetical protein
VFELEAAVGNPRFGGFGTSQHKCRIFPTIP